MCRAIETGGYFDSFDALGFAPFNPTTTGGFFSQEVHGQAGRPEPARKKNLYDSFQKARTMCLIGNKGDRREKKRIQN